MKSCAGWQPRLLSLFNLRRKTAAAFRALLCHVDRVFVIPTEVEEWSGLGSRDIDGKAEKLSEREAKESISRYLASHHLAASIALILSDN